jgi:o-succinylbenzoate---CoA ligase
VEFKTLEHITLNGKSFSKTEILSNKIPVPHSFLNREDKPFFDEVIEFLRDWFSESKDIIVQTSGSTGIPKQIAIPKQSFVESAQNTCFFLKLTKETNALLCIPVKYIGGKMMVIRALVSGYNLWIKNPKSSPLKEFNESCSFLAITPMQANFCLNETPEKLNTIKHVIIGGGAVSTAFINKTKDYYTQFYSTYGMTETVSHIAMQRINGKKKSEIFELLPSYSVSVNMDNCLVIDCPTLMPEKITTHDIVELYPNGFKWLGRKDNVINSGGIKISPEEIEKKIQKHYPNLIFYITSKKDSILGEKLVLVTQEEVSLNFQEIGLENYKMPKEIIVKTIQFTETEKIKREKF